MAEFWHALCMRKNTKILLSTALYSETDGQTERFNAVLECYLRAYCNYQQDNWVDWLPSAEYNANDSESESTDVAPFFANSAQHPRSTITPKRIQGLANSGHTEAQQNLADHFVDQMQSLSCFLRENMRTAQVFYEKYANIHRSPSPEY